MSIESRRQDREDRVMGALDLATMPIQAAKSIGQFFAIAAIALGLLIGLPIYLLLTGHPVSPAQWENMGLAVMFLFTLVYTPWYTIIGAIAAYAAIGIFTPTFDSLWRQFGGRGLIFFFLLIGITQRFMRQMFRWIGNPGPPRRRLYPSERMMIAQRLGCAFSDTPEWEPIESAEEKERKQNENDKEECVRETIEKKHHDVIEKMSAFVSLCRKPLEDALHGVSVLNGDNLVSADEALLIDIWQIWTRLQRADGNYCSDAPKHLLRAICCQVEPKLITASDWEYLVCNLYPTFASQTTAASIRLPGVVSMLAKYDGHARTQHASKAADTFRAVLLSLASLLNDSIPVKMVVDKYLKVLEPYIKVSDAGSTEPMATSTATASGRNTQLHTDG